LDIPEGWNVTLDETEIQIGQGQTESVEVRFEIPRNDTLEEMQVLVRGISTTRGELITEYLVELELPNLDIEDKDVIVLGDDASIGRLDLTPIPGFETSALLIALLVGVMLARRRRKAGTKRTLRKTEEDSK